MGSYVKYHGQVCVDADRGDGRFTNELTQIAVRQHPDQKIRCQQSPERQSCVTPGVLGKPDMVVGKRK